MPKTIGIDLGTSNSAAAVMEGGKPALIPSAEGTSLGGKAFPSYVAVAKDGQRLAGEPARRQAVVNPEGTAYAFKRKMGADHTYTLRGKEFTPQQLSGFLLQKIKRDSEAHLGGPVEKAVITVPAYFNDNQRQATKDAGRIAGLDVVRIINEPTAACLAYGIDKREREEKIMVFDLGGGTLDVTIMEFGRGVFQVISTAGDTQVGGTDMDSALVDHLAGEFRKESGIDLRQDKMALQRFREAAETAKIELSSTLETEINLPFITADAAGPRHFQLKLSRATLEKLVQPILDRCTPPVDQALSDSKLTPEMITRIILVGGPTRMPIVQRFLEEHVGRRIERGVDPMECVVFGAAIQAAVLAGEVKDVLLLDVTPLSLGIETQGGVFIKLIERNTTIPTRKSQIFSTAEDGQAAVTVHVLQGERPLVKDNVSLGRFDLDGLPPAPRGVPQIDVIFDLDASGILNVSAKDLGSDKQQHVAIQAKNKLAAGEVEKYVQEAEKFAEEDRRVRERIEAANETNALVYATERSLKEYGDKVSQEELMAVEQALSGAREAAKGDDTERIRSARQELAKASHKLAEQVYKAAGAAKAPGGEQNADRQEPLERVVDVEVVKK